MTHLEKVGSIVGALLVGLAAYLAIAERKSQRRDRAQDPPVEELAHKLQEAWAGYHTR
jgi:hypothetical protein